MENEKKNKHKCAPEDAGLLAPEGLPHAGFVGVSSVSSAQEVGFGSKRKN
jgi:hypothetical protein